MLDLRNSAARSVHCFICSSDAANKVATIAARHLDGACRIDVRRPGLVIVRLRRPADAIVFRMVFADKVLREFRVLSGPARTGEAGPLFAGGQP
jgi:hypothetical protein